MFSFKKRFISVAAAAVAVVGCCLSFAGCLNSDNLAAHRDARNAVTKKGVCVSRYNDGEKSSAQKIENLNPSWYYTWGVKSNNEFIDAEFVPMIWGSWQLTKDNLDYVKQNYESGKFTHLLTFNEPDLLDQANMSVDTALSYWEQLEEIGIPLSSPVVSWYNRRDDDPNAGNPWLDEFMEKAEERGLRVDFIAVHSYQPFYLPDMAKSLKEDTLDFLYEKYHKPIWLTEFGAIDVIARDSGSTELMPNCTEESAVKYIKETTDMLESCGYVERYSWFLDNLQDKGDNRPFEAVYTSLYNDDDTIAKTGDAYRDVASNVPLFLLTENLNSATAGTAYTHQVIVCGGTGGYEFSASGLPEGLTISKSGKISGKTAQAGYYDVQITVTDSGPAKRKQTVTYNFLLKVK